MILKKTIIQKKFHFLFMTIVFSKIAISKRKLRGAVWNYIKK